VLDLIVALRQNAKILNAQALRLRRVEFSTTRCDIDDPLRVSVAFATSVGVI